MSRLTTSSTSVLALDEQSELVDGSGKRKAKQSCAHHGGAARTVGRTARRRPLAPTDDHAHRGPGVRAGGIGPDRCAHSCCSRSFASFAGVRSPHSPARIWTLSGAPSCPRQFLIVAAVCRLTSEVARRHPGRVFRSAIVPPLRHHSTRTPVLFSDRLVFPNERGNPLRRGNFGQAVSWETDRARLGVRFFPFTSCDIQATRWRRSRAGVCAI